MTMSSLNIVYVSPYILSKPSAPAINIIEMCSAFSKNKCDILLCVPKSQKDRDSLFRYYGVEHPFAMLEINLPKLFHHHFVPGKKLLFAILASKKLRRLKKHLIYTRSPWVFFLMSVIYRQRCFFEAHQFRYVKFMQSYFYRTIVKKSVEHGNGVIVCISNVLKKQWEEYGINKERLFVAHDAVNATKFSNTASNSQAKKQLKIHTKAPIVVYTGSLLKGKGVDVLLQSANLLPKTQFIIVGGDDKQIKKLGNLAQHNNVTFTGHVSPEKIPLYQAAADILALPNTRGSVIDDVTSPMKLFEYMASNRPIVATDIPSIMEILVHNHNALISTAGDSQQLSEHIDKLLNNPSLCQTLTSNANSLLNQYTWEKRANFLTELFKQDQGLHPIASTALNE